ncbi:MAG: oligosaccharide flippase family protein [Clostridia bacterium]|nr:oligosaccharide flippase family protein [Clostridia bacterium]
MKIKKALGSNRGILLKNTIMLYILQFSTYLLALLVAPYETRVLGADVYGGFLEASASIIIYFQLVIDFGFLLSATEEVSRYRSDKKKLSEIFTSVTMAKIGLSIGSFAIMMLLCQIIPAWEKKQTVLILTFVASMINSMIPDFLYRGLERMSAITVRTVLVKIFFTGSIFIFLKKPEDVWIVPALNVVGNSVALLLAYVHVAKKLDVHFCKPSVVATFKALRTSAFFFFSRIATTAYTALNTVILDIITNSGAPTGYYTSANKLITAGKNGLTPIADSLYPYMTRNRDFKLVKKVLLILEPIIIVFCAVIFVFSKEFCVWFFGADFAEAGSVLRAMLPIGVVTLPSYIFGFPMLTAMGISKHANYSTIFGSVFHIVLLAILFAFGKINMISLALSVSATSTAILLYRIVVIVKNRHLMYAKPEGENTDAK